MPKQMLDKYADTKDSIIKARDNMNAKDISIAKEEVLKECQVYDVDTELENNNGKLYTIDNGIATINISGMLVQKVDFCSAFFGESLTTYAYIKQASLEADNDPLVKKVLYIADSGGGVVSGCEETATVIREMSKPTITAVKNMSASACYWLASATDEIISISKTGFYGSIGVAVEIIDRSKQDEEAGIRRIVMTNDDSSDKRPDLMTDEGQEVLTKELNDIYNVFVDSILEKRSNVLTKDGISALKGKVFISSEAKELGLVDKIMTEKELKTYLSTGNVNNSLNSGSIKIEKESRMNLADFLKENPEAQNEYSEAIKAETEKGIMADRERGAKILKLSGLDINEGILNAFNNGDSVGDFAANELVNRNKAIKNAKPTDLGTIEPKGQLPESSKIENKEASKAESTMDSAIDKLLNKGAK